MVGGREPLDPRALFRVMADSSRTARDRPELITGNHGRGGTQEITCVLASPDKATVLYLELR